MKNITLKQMRKDYEFLDANIGEYFVDEDGLVNRVFVELLSGEMDMKGYLLWCIEDLVHYVYNESEDEEDINFLETNKRAIRILDRYNIGEKINEG